MKEEGPMRGAQGAISAMAGPGPEKPVSPRRVQEGGSAASAAGTRGSLSTAVGHLHSEHPIKHDDHGPHHGGSTHVRHAPGIRPNKGHPYG